MPFFRNSGKINKNSSFSNHFLCNAILKNKKKKSPQKLGFRQISIFFLKKKTRLVRSVLYRTKTFRKWKKPQNKQKIISRRGPPNFFFGAPTLTHNVKNCTPVYRKLKERGVDTENARSMNEYKVYFTTQETHTHSTHMRKQALNPVYH